MAGENDYYRSVGFYRAAMPPEKRTPDGEYERRLRACKDCRELRDGTCMQCGCYVEMRAARVDARCPLRNGPW